MTLTFLPVNISLGSAEKLKMLSVDYVRSLMWQSRFHIIYRYASYILI